MKGKASTTYSKNHPNILDHDNDGNKIRKVLNNRLDSFGQSVTGTVIKNDSDPPVIFSLFSLRGNSESKCNRPLNPKGDQSRSMVYCKLVEDSGLKPNEFSVYCEQCNDHHLVHNGGNQKIWYVSKNPEPDPTWELRRIPPSGIF